MKPIKKSQENRNKKSNRKIFFSEVVFANFWPWAAKLFAFELKIRFLVKNYICSPQEMPRIPKCGHKVMKYMFYYDLC